MSDMWGAGLAPFTAPAVAMPFTPWTSRLMPGFGTADAEDEEIVPAPVNLIDPEEVAVGAFSRGYEEGCRAMEEELAAERAAMGELVAALQALRPEPPAALAALIAETVGRLVRQIVGEVPVDAALLLDRAEAAAAIVADETRPVRMRLSPGDRKLLSEAGLEIELVADPAIDPGAILIDTNDGWIEDGPAAALARLSAQLDRMGIAR